MFGRVQTDPSGQDFLGAEIGSNNTAEITAIVKALQKINAINTPCTAQIRYDSKYAKKQITK